MTCHCKNLDALTIAKNTSESVIFDGSVCIEIIM